MVQNSSYENMAKTPPVWDENPIRAQRRKDIQEKLKRYYNIVSFAKRTEKRTKTDGSNPET